MPSSSELSRLLSAAVINRRFRDLLLTDLPSALATGYQEEMFHLSPEESALLLSIRAESLPDFARQLLPASSASSAESTS